MPHPLYNYGPPVLTDGETGTPATTTGVVVTIPGTAHTPPANSSNVIYPGGSPSEEQEALYDPNISTLTPNTAVAGTPVPVTVTGLRFFPSSVVEADHVPVATTYVSATQLTCTLNRATAGVTVVTVRNGFSAMESNDVNFTFTAAEE